MDLAKVDPRITLGLLDDALACTIHKAIDDFETFLIKYQGILTPVTTESAPSADIVTQYRTEVDVRRGEIATLFPKFNATYATQIKEFINQGHSTEANEVHGTYMHLHTALQQRSTEVSKMLLHIARLEQQTK